MISFNSSVTYGQAGSPFGSELLLNVPVGPMYLSASSQAQLATVLPALCLFTLPAGVGGLALQYTPDNGTTWRTTSSTLLYVDTGGTIRLFNSTPGGGLNVFLVPYREAKV